MMLTIRDIESIETEQGRLGSAAVTHEMADRVRALFPEGQGARFTRAAYAVVFLDPVTPSNEMVQKIAHSLLALRAPLEAVTNSEQIDVVASMAQRDEADDAATFVQRANLGLARAVRTLEPTLVAMP